jgi:hypothetical protein
VANRLGRAVLELTTKGAQTVLSEIDEVHKRLGGTSNSVQAFARQHQQSFAAIGQAAVLATGAITAIGVGVVALGRRGAVVSDVASAFKSLSEQAGSTSETMLGALRRGVVGTVSNFELMKLANKALGAGLLKTAEDAETLSAGARALAKRVGIDTSKAFETLTHAMASGRTSQLKQLGLFVDSKVAVEEFARANKKATGDLTDAERATALSTAALASLRKELKENAPPAADFGEIIDRGKATVQNFTDNLSVAIAQSPAVQAAMRMAGEAFEGAFGGDQAQLIEQLIGWVNRLVLFLVDLGRNAITVAGFIVQAFYGVRAILFSTLEALVTLGQGWIDLQIRIMQAANAMTVGNPFDAQIAKLKETRTFMDGVRDSFGESKDAALDAAASWRESFATADEKLTALRAEMARLIKEGVNIDEVVKRLRQTGEAAGLSAAQVKTLAAAEAKRAQALRDFYNWRGEREIEDAANVQKAAEAKAAADRAYHNWLGERYIEDVAAQQAALDAKAAAQREYYNWLGERQMEDLARQMAHAKVLRTTMSQAMQSLPNVILGAIQGGGSVPGAIGSHLGGSLGTGLVKRFGESITGALGATLGGAVNSILPGVGALMGPLLGKLFGPSEASKTRKARDQWIEQFGGIEKLKAEATAAGISLDKLFAARKGKDFEREVKAVTAALEKHRAEVAALKTELSSLQSEQERLTDETTITWDKMRAAAERYGITQDNIGQQGNQLRSNASAQELIDDFAILTEGGTSVGAVLSGMRERIQAIAQDSIKFGTTIPENMKPWIQNLIDTNQLFDESGEAITDIEQMKFGEAMASQLEKAQTRLADVMERIAAILEKLTQLDGKQVSFTVTGEYDEADVRTRGPRGGDNEGFATGTLGRLGSFWGDFGRQTRTLLHNVQAVVTPSQAPAFAMDVMRSMSPALPGGGAMGASGGVNVIVINGQGMRPDQLRDEIMRNLGSSVAKNEHGVRVALTNILRGRS